MRNLVRISWKIANYTEIWTLGTTFWDLGTLGTKCLKKDLGDLRDQVAALKYDKNCNKRKNHKENKSDSNTKIREVSPEGVVSCKD